jgi:hypothetical protein
MKKLLALPPSQNTPFPYGLGCSHPEVCCKRLCAEDRKALSLGLAFHTVT